MRSTADCCTSRRPAAYGLREACGTLLGVQVIRVYDASRQPRDWMEIIRPGQFVVFASLLDGEAPCSLDGVPTGNGAATCAIVDSLDEAEALSRDRVEHHPAVRFDIFDARGRSQSPLLTVVHPTRVSSLEGDPKVRRRNRAIAIILIVTAAGLFWADWRSGGEMIFPTLLAFNLLLLAGRLLQLNAAYSAAERRRLARLEGRDK